MYQKINQFFFFGVYKNDFPRFIDHCCTFLYEKLPTSHAPSSIERQLGGPRTVDPMRTGGYQGHGPRQNIRLVRSVYHACMRLFSCKNNSLIKHHTDKATTTAVCRIPAKRTNNITIAVVPRLFDVP